ncbi:hypothetical protein F0562_019970 [Nyssa sinensis]|uniref:C2H2-type domain-containing protein n=1 Tax=Nyssa sinensis TaxID=561372 RepID=A0A5J5BV43_9ASTE|nr:hypothetical protein F0562_019970 [Nyssa sinensis]
MSNISVDGGSFSSGNTGEEEVHEQQQQQLYNQFNGSNLKPPSSSTANSNGSTCQQQQPPLVKKRRNQPGTPDPSAEVIALSPKTLMATNRFVCEICSKGKHGEKKWKCDKCSKKYAVQSDWKAHSKTCGTKEYKCDCGTIFSRRDSFITHRAFCDALTEENSKVNQGLLANMGGNIQGQVQELMSTMPVNNNPDISVSEFSHPDTKNPLKSLPQEVMPSRPKPLKMAGSVFSSSSTGLFSSPRNISSCLHLGANSFEDSHQLGGSAHMSATALLQKAAQMGATVSSNINSPMVQKSFVTSMAPSSYSGISLQHSSSYDGFASHELMQKGLQESKSSQFFDTRNGEDHESPGMDNMGMYDGIFNQNHGLLKDIKEHNDNNDTILHGGLTHSSRNDPTVLSIFAGNESNDAMTLDFLGIGGTRLRSLHEQQQQGMKFDAINQQRMQGLSPIQQQISNEQATLEKPMWNV